MTVSRRSFVVGAAAIAAGVGGLEYFATHQNLTSPELMRPWLESGRDHPEYADAPGIPDNAPGVDIKYSVCLMCAGGCGIRAKVKDGVLLKNDGNPYHPNTFEPHLPYDTDPQEARKTLGSVCLKGQTGRQRLYDAKMIKHPLKRVGPRGSGKWRAISWDQAITEIVEGGDLFGEGSVEGLRSVRDLKTPIDPAAPELGPKANQFVLASGRIQNGQAAFQDRFAKGAYGTVNSGAHTVLPSQAPDIVNSSFVIFWGESPLEADFPMQTLVRKIMRAKVLAAHEGSEAVQGQPDSGAPYRTPLKMAVVDPHFSQSAAKADVWVPVRPGADGALALGMIRWIIAQKRYNRKFLSLTGQAAAKKNGETVWTNATYLVRQDTRAFLRGDEAGLGGTHDDFVVLEAGQPVLARTVETADLEGSATVAGIHCRTAFSLLSDRTREMSEAEYEKITGVKWAMIAGLAREFTSHGTRAAVDWHRGPVKHTNGQYATMGIQMLNTLIGNINHKGGITIGGGAWDFTGKTPGYRYNLAELLPGKVKAKGIGLTRGNTAYEITTEFKNNGYPAKRPWFPFASNLGQELMAAMISGYPYPTKILFLDMMNRIYSVPGFHESLPAYLKDPKRLPLFVSIDTTINDTNIYADYILPETSYLERWDTVVLAPSIVAKAVGVRQPVVPRLYPDRRSLEEILIALAKKMNLPGFGDNGFGPSDPLNTPEDWYRKLVANIAYGEGPADAVAGGTENDKVRYVLARGGRFAPLDSAYQGERMVNAKKGQLPVYNEKMALAKNSMTGQPFDGLPKYEPIQSARGKVMTWDGYPLTLISYKYVWHGLANTMQDPWLAEIWPHNWVEINTKDAAKYGIEDGARVKVVSVSYPQGIVGLARVTEGIRPGVVGMSHHYGLTQYGSKPYYIDGKDAATPLAIYRSAGVNANWLTQLDPDLGVGPLEDVLGGGISFYDTHVKVIPV